MRHYTGEVIALAFPAKDGTGFRADLRLAPLAWGLGEDLDGRGADGMTPERSPIYPTLDRDMGPQTFDASPLMHSVPWIA